MEQQEKFTLEEARVIIEKERKEKKYTIDEADREISYIMHNVEGWYRARIPMRSTREQKHLGGILVPHEKRMLYGASK